MNAQMLDLPSVAIYVAWTISCIVLVRAIVTALRRNRRKAAGLSPVRSITPARSVAGNRLRSQR